LKVKSPNGFSLLVALMSHRLCRLRLGGRESGTLSTQPVRHQRCDVVSALHKAHDILMREINPVTYSEKEFKQRLKKKEHFITSVWKGKKILLTGALDEFKGLGGK